MRHPAHNRNHRRGAYAALTAVMITAIMGIGALAVDVAYMRLVQAQAQGIADAASQAALLELRRTGSTREARAAADAVAALNLIGATTGEIAELHFGVWDHDLGSLDPTLDAPNAVRAVVTTEGHEPLDYHLAPVLGFEDFQVRAQATAAGRRLTLVVVQDSTHSWSQEDYGNARGALLTLLDTLTNSYGSDDLVGLATFNYRYAYEFTPLTTVQSIAEGGTTVWADWSALNVFSEAGVPAHWGCREHRGRGSMNNFNAPPGGCFPANPRAYLDEWGTDHTTGLSMAKQMFEENDDPNSFNVLLVLTDGKPNYLVEGSGYREASGYVEERWRQFEGPVPRSGSEIRNGSVALTEQMWDEMRVHSYVVSFTADDWAMQAMPQGQGYYTLTNDSEALTPMLQAIADSIPLTLVE